MMECLDQNNSLGRLIKMNNAEVRIVRLEPVYVASSLGFGPNPEELAWNQLLEWIKQSGLSNKIAGHRFLGFNNPSPSVGSPNYGYEQWVTVDIGTQGAQGIALKEFRGGLYAVARCKLAVITDAWKALIVWRESSVYKPAHHQWLEECLGTPLEQAIGPDTEFDLYMPIAE
jgi:DNA gyrase inhibitor GyrI